MYSVPTESLLSRVPADVKADLHAKQETIAALTADHAKLEAKIAELSSHERKHKQREEALSAQRDQGEKLAAQLLGEEPPPERSALIVPDAPGGLSAQETMAALQALRARRPVALQSIEIAKGAFRSALYKALLDSADVVACEYIQAASALVDARVLLETAQRLAETVAVGTGRKPYLATGPAWDNFVIPGSAADELPALKRMTDTKTMSGENIFCATEARSRTHRLAERAFEDLREAVVAEFGAFPFGRV